MSFPSLPLFTDAFLADTGHLDAQETGVYLLLLMMAWRSPGCQLPDDDRDLARWARVDKRTWFRIKARVMSFWRLSGGFWVQSRLSKEHDIVSKRAEVARQNGQHGGRPKPLKDKGAENPAGSSWGTQKKAPNPNPIEEKKEETPNGVSCSSGDEPAARPWPKDSFDRFWKAYPRKVSKGAARKAFAKASKTESLSLVDLLSAVDRYVRMKPPSLDFCHPATWLNGERWLDELEDHGTTNGAHRRNEGHLAPSGRRDAISTLSQIAIGEGDQRGGRLETPFASDGGRVIDLDPNEVIVGRRFGTC